MALLAALVGFSMALICPAASATDTKPTTKPATTTAPATAPAAVSKPAPRSEEDVMLDFLRDYQPEVYKWVEVVKAKDPAKYSQMRRELIPDTRKLLGMKESRPAVFEASVKDRRLTFRSMQISRDLRAADATANPEEANRLRYELKETVTQQFETRQLLRKFELEEQQKRLEAVRKQLDEMKKTLEDRENQKADLISNHVEDLLKPTPKVEW